jgi:tetratricopeptide (TPR) repeat protein
VVALGRADDSERESSGPGAADAPARGLALAAVLVCLAFALAGTLPQPLAQRSGLDGAAAAAATTLLVAVAAALCVGGALLARAGPPNSRSVLLPFAATATLPVAALLGALALRQDAATEPHAAAETAALGFRAIGLGLLLAAAAAGWSLHRAASRPRERHEWRRAAVAIALFCVAGLAFDRLAARRVTADTLAKHGLVWLELRSPAVGWQLLDAASRLDPREPVHWMERARVDLQRAARDPSPRALVADAVHSLERAIELAPREADAWANLGLARLLTRDDRPDALEAAGRAYERALELRPDWPQVLESVAAVAALQGDEGAAARWQSRARALAPEAR